MSKQGENICKKETGTAFAIAPTQATLDAKIHAEDLMNQRANRANSAVEIVNPANVRRLTNEDDGDKSDGEDLGYPMEELEALKEPQKIGKPAPTPVIEDENEMPSEDD